VAPSFGSYIAGSLAVIGIVAALGLGGYWLRRWIVPEFSGALARLADATLAVALLLISLEILGTFSVLRFGWIIFFTIAVGLGAALLGYWRAPDRDEEVKAPQVTKWALILAIAVASFTMAEWSFPSQLNLDLGMFGGDTTWYHMPFAATMAQQHSTVHLHYTDPLRLAAWFYPQSSELVHAAAIVLFKSDWLSPLINLFWLAIALLGCWCVGRPYKVGPATLIAGAIILDSGVMIETQPGEARNDIMGLAFLVAFAAFLINAHQRRAPQEGAAVQDAPERDAPLLDKGPLIMAGIAAGLAASVKTTFLVPVAAIAIGVFLFSGKGRRWTTAWILGLSMLITGGYWYLRAAIKTGGNPIPITKFGPLHLPVPDQMPLDPRPRFAVAHYLTEPNVYRHWFFPQLENALGPVWPLILIMAGAAALFIVVRSRNKILRVIAAAALLTAVVYVFTPLTAAGQEGAPTGFFTNTRYLIPGLILAMVMLPIARPLRAPDRRAQITLIFLAVVYWVTVLTTPKWYSAYLLGAVFITLALVWTPTALGLGRSRGVLSRRVVTAAAAVVVLLAVVLGRAQQVQYSNQHYTDTKLFLQEGGPQKAYAFAQKLQHKRIGIVGSSEIIFGQYGFFGNPPTNEVDFIGVPGPHGAYRLATTCPQLMGRINASEYDYLIMSENTEDSPEAEFFYPINAWVKNDPALKLVIEEPTIVPEPDYVYKVEGKMSPRYCPTPKQEEEAVEEVVAREIETEEREAAAEAREHEEAEAAGESGEEAEESEADEAEEETGVE
jgi:hypothetical protein